MDQSFRIKNRSKSCNSNIAFIFVYCLLNTACTWKILLLQSIGRFFIFCCCTTCHNGVILEQSVKYNIYFRSSAAFFTLTTILLSINGSFFSFALFLFDGTTWALPDNTSTTNFDKIHEKI